MPGKHSRNKGARFERQVVRDLQEVFKMAQVLRHGETQRDGNDTVPDVQVVDWLALEVKHHKTYPSVVGELETAHRRMSGDEIPVAVVKGDRKRAIAALYWEDLLLILGDWYEENW